jgi:hypothetical protein
MQIVSMQKVVITFVFGQRRPGCSAAKASKKSGDTER